MADNKTSKKNELKMDNNNQIKKLKKQWDSFVLAEIERLSSESFQEVNHK